MVAYFNQQYVATGCFEGTIGRLLARLQKKREVSDYDDFYIASFEEAVEQIEAAESILSAIKLFVGTLD